MKQIKPMCADRVSAEDINKRRKYVHPANSRGNGSSLER